jgi:hypothetical protein
LTPATGEPTIPPMQRETLETILQRAEGIELDGDQYKVAESHDVTVLLGRPGQAMPVPHVVCLRLEGTHVELTARERGTLYTTYDAIHALLDSAKQKRDGTNVGF